jgi:hypothetical protein
MMRLRGPQRELYDLLQQGHPCEQSLFTHRWRCNQRWFTTRVIARLEARGLVQRVLQPRPGGRADVPQVVLTAAEQSPQDQGATDDL